MESISSLDLHVLSVSVCTLFRCSGFHLPQPSHVRIRLIGNSKLFVVRVHLAVCLCVLTINCQPVHTVTLPSINQLVPVKP